MPLFSKGKKTAYINYLLTSHLNYSFCCALVCFLLKIPTSREICVSNGELISASECSEVILFTVDDKILKCIADYDAKAGKQV